MSLSRNETDITWMEWFTTRESAVAINKQHQEKLFSTFNASISKSDCIEALMQHHETVFLNKSNFGSKRINLFHHIDAVGGTIYDEKDREFGMIQGLGKLTAVAVNPDIDILCKVPNENAVAIPSTTSILNINNIDQIQELTVSATVTYKARNFIPVPPFLLETIFKNISKSSGQAAQVLLEVVKEIKNFDILHANDAEYVDKARSKCKDILFWLYLVHTEDDSIEALPTMNCNSEKLIRTIQSAANNCLQVQGKARSSIADQVESSLKRPFEVLATASSSTSEFMERLTQIQSQQTEKSAKSFKKLPTKYQNMILVASSTGEITDPEYCADAKEFFKSSNTLHAQVMLNSLFETEGLDISVSSAVVTSLLYGSFLWRNAMSPSGFAASVLTTEGVFRSDTLHEGMVLDFSTKFDMSQSSLNKLTKSHVVFPTDVEDTIQRLKGIKLLSNFFFKKSSYLSQGLTKIVNFCTDNKMILRKNIHLDSKFIAKLICAVDERIYLWLKQCGSYHAVTDTDVSLVEFTSLTSDIQLSRFNYVLPPSVSKVSKMESEVESPNERNKKKKIVEARRNLDIEEEWKIRPTETWDTVFKNKVKEAPFLSIGCKPCLKYQVKGICYTDCINQASHCKLHGEDKVKVSNFIKGLRGE
jgi:hypothetical protein